MAINRSFNTNYKGVAYWKDSNKLVLVNFLESKNRVYIDDIVPLNAIIKYYEGKVLPLGLLDNYVDVGGKRYVYGRWKKGTEDKLEFEKVPKAGKFNGAY